MVINLYDMPFEDITSFSSEFLSSAMRKMFRIEGFFKETIIFLDSENGSIPNETCSFLFASCQQ